ncbi:10730_t:CDS:1 [Cetraspora pellucida]|uniref:10730_t:CDS:1 n=1 Tax=Cetraspora pellucida TaxID=1433469 RepID=A0ACA9N0W6_9GLOM|nr:10730_t:CDS:1 [Cetraspora pellucida]
MADNPVNMPDETNEILSRENEYLRTKICEELNKWRLHNFKSTKESILSIIICILFCARESQFAELGKKISTGVIGIGGTFTLFGSMNSLKDLFKQIDENKQEIDKLTNNLFKTPDDDKITKDTFAKGIDLKEHKKHQKTILRFLNKINKHMRYMLVSRTIYIVIASLIFIILALISIFLLIFTNDQNDPTNEFIFKIINIILISLSSYFLSIALSILICVQLVVPRIMEIEGSVMFELEAPVEQMLKSKMPNLQENSKISNQQENSELKEFMKNEKLNIKNSIIRKINEKNMNKIEDMIRKSIVNDLKKRFHIEDDQEKISKFVKEKKDIAELLVNLRYNDKIRLLDLFGILFYECTEEVRKNKDEADAQKVVVFFKSLITKTAIIFKFFELFIFFLFHWDFYIIGLMSWKFEFKKISITATQMDGINRVIFGLPVLEDNHHVIQVDDTENEVVD